MMKKLILFFLLFPVLVFSQSWEKAIGTNEVETGYSVQQTTDGGYIIGGIKGVNSDSLMLLVKTDGYGNVSWINSYGGDYKDIGRSVRQTYDGGYVIAGYSWSYGNGSCDVCLIKTNSYGDTQWIKTYGGVNSVRGYSVEQTQDSGFIIVGFIPIYGSGKDVYLIKTDINGDTIWTRNYDKSVSDYAYSVKQTFDGGYIITGQTQNDSYITDVYLIRTDSEGDTIWTKNYGCEYHDWSYSVQQTSDSGFIVAGGTYPMGNSMAYTYLIKTDAAGDTIWTKKYGKINASESANSVHQTIDGGYIICGHASEPASPPTQSDVYITKTNSFGEIMWTKTFGGEGYDYGYSVQQTSDGGYIIAGTTYSFGSVDMYLIKTDENGIVTFVSDIPLQNANRKLIKTIDLQGKEIQPRENIPYIEVYNDGSTEKKLIVK